MVRIETKRLILREYCREDWQQVHVYSKDPVVTRFMLWGPNTEEQTKEFIQRTIEAQSQDPRHSFELAVELKESGLLVGGVGMRIKNERRREADLGYCYNPSVWGKGIGTEAAQAMLTFGFETLKMHRIWATCDVDNHGSAKIMRKNGMTQEAHFRRDELIRGQWRDTLLHAILEEEWAELNQRKEAVQICVST